MDLKKIIAKLPTGFAEEADKMSDTKLKDLMLQCETNIESIEKSQDEDDRLKGARELVKEMSAPYRDAKSAQRYKIKYVLHLLGERGKLPEADINVEGEEG